MLENERKWKNEKTWKNEKNEKNRKNEKNKKIKKWKKWKKNKKWKKWKKLKKWKKWKNEKNKKMKKIEKMKKKKTTKNVEKCWKNKRNWIHTQNPRRFPWFCFGMCLCPEENQKPVLGSYRFYEEKWQCSLDVKQKHTFYLRKSTKKKSLRSAHLTTIILLQKFNHSTTTIIQSGEAPF